MTNRLFIDLTPRMTGASGGVGSLFLFQQGRSKDMPEKNGSFHFSQRCLYCIDNKHDRKRDLFHKPRTAL
jgi:hypothetical protein